MQYFEDIEIGGPRQYPTGYTLTVENITGFCREWDPLPFHLDEEVARNTPMGRLFTSAAHLVCIALKLGHSAQDAPTAVIAGLGWDEVRFHRPGFAGDTLYLRGSVLDKRVSVSRPERGIVTNLMELVNQDGERVASYQVSTLVARRPES